MKYFILIFVLGLPLNVLGQERGDSTIDVILLGTFHYGQTTDANQTDFSDLFSERRQKELEALTNQLAKQNITKIFIERTLARQSKPFIDPKQKLTLTEQSLPDYYIKLNNEYHRKKSSYDYLHYAMSYVDVESDDYTGPDFSAIWYERNLKIYANILNEIEESDEVILVLFGSSHTHIFNYFFSEHPKFNIMRLEDILSN